MSLSKYRADFIAVAVLVALWLLFFWRLLTPVIADQVSIVEGDFSRQFVTFGAYQYDRFTAGEIPLWNPYNNGGLPFIADTQAAVFYPLRLLTIAVTHIIGGEWTYNTLQMEMIAHVLLYTLLTYLFVQRLITGNRASVYAALTAAIITGYGGFMTGYPPLQLALLEAAVWLPLALLGVLEASRHEDRLRWAWLALSSMALGLSWMAGHPQTSWFATYAVVGYLMWRVYIRRYRWWQGLLGIALIGIMTFGIAAVQLLPGLEYLARTMRTGLGFAEKGNGFPPRDVLQFVIPGVVSVYSPLYVGVSGLVLAGVGLAGQARDRVFFALLAIVALILSLGANGALYHALYNVLPGLSFFRGQERAAYLVMNALAVLAGLGVAHLGKQPDTKHLRRGVFAFAGILLLLAGAVIVAWLGDRAAYADEIGPVTFSAVIAGVTALLLTVKPRMALVGVVALVAFELFSVNIDNPANYAPVPAAERAIMQTPPLVERIREDTAENAPPFRVEGNQVNGEIGIYGGGNTGTLYELADIRGISPLFLDGPHAIIQREMPQPVAWELFAVRYVLTDAEELPVASDLIARDYPDGQTLNLHRLSDPRPFAYLLYDYTLVGDDAAARDQMRDSALNLRETAVLHRAPTYPPPESVPAQADATVTDYAPESFTVQVDTPENALLSLAHVDYPGWEFRLNGEMLNAIRTYGGLTALSIPAGTYNITATYEPISFVTGAGLSLVTWAGLFILGVIVFIRRNK